jgi:hypothetical protein
MAAQAVAISTGWLPWAAPSSEALLVKNLKDLKLLEREDLLRRAQDLLAEHRAQRKLERAERRRAAWPRWTAWWEKRAGELKIAATVMTSLGVIATCTVAGVKKADAIWHWARGVWALYTARDREVQPLPPPTDAPTTAVDFPKTAPRPPRVP